MYHLVLCFAVALLCSGCQAARVNKHLRLLPDLDNSIETNGLPTKHAGARRFLALNKRPNATYAHAPGSVLALTCEALGAPAPTVRWFRNAQPVYKHDSESMELIDINPSSLGRISSTLLVTRTDQVDEYSCLASAGSKTARATTTVYSTGSEPDTSERSRLLPREPHIVVSYRALVDTIGSAVVLPCRARGHPRPRFTWRDNNGTLVRRNERMKVLKSGELVISSLRWSDMGQFTCRATNAFGAQQANTFLYPALAG